MNGKEGGDESAWPNRKRQFSEREKQQAAKKEMDNQLKNILGESRFADYERAQDWAYQGIYRVAERYELPKDAANRPALIGG